MKLLQPARTGPREAHAKLTPRSTHLTELLPAGPVPAPEKLDRTKFRH